MVSDQSTHNLAVELLMAKGQNPKGQNPNMSNPKGVDDKVAHESKGAQSALSPPDEDTDGEGVERDFYKLILIATLASQLQIRS